MSLDPNERIGKLRQDQFAFEEFTVLDTVIMGHAELWEVKQERDRIYALAEMSEEDGYKVADLETQYGEMAVILQKRVRASCWAWAFRSNSITAQ